MATTNYRVTRETLLAAINAGAKEVIDNKFDVTAQASTLETLARAYALVVGNTDATRSL